MRAFITGIAGQDGLYLAKWLAANGYEVHGGVRARSEAALARIRHADLGDRLRLHDCDLLAAASVLRCLDEVRPHEIYNLAGLSSVSASFLHPDQTMAVNATAVIHLLDWIRRQESEVRFYQASSSEMFGGFRREAVDETTPFAPCSPYGVSKLAAHWTTEKYRAAFGLHACSGLLFNHESPLRPIQFVTRKITSTLARIACGADAILQLGNLDASRDWGFAGDYAIGMWRMLQHPTAGDYVLATGRACSIRDFVTKAAACLGWGIEWSGEGQDEVAIDHKTGRTLVRVNPEFYRPVDIDCVVGNPIKAETVLGWRRRLDLDGLIELMVRSDLNLASSGRPAWSLDGSAF